MPVHGRRQKRCGLQHWAALPQPLLELILVACTNTEEKKTLRQTCKLFQSTIDNKLSCLQLTLGGANDRDLAVKMLKRIQHVNSLRTLDTQLNAKAPLDKLLRYLPSHITTLRIYGTVTKTAALKKLPLLTSLSLDEGGYTVAELTGLTYLRCGQRVGNPEPCPRELKLLDIGAVSHLQRIDKLTKLEVLCVNNISSTFFATHSQLPLKHLSITKPGFGPYVLCNDKTWVSAPTTLERLTLDATCKLLHRQHLSRILPSVLPAHITHLQLIVSSIYMIREAVTALPGLKQFDVCTRLYNMTSWDVFYDVSKLTNLQSLGICVEYTAQYLWWDVQRYTPELLRLGYSKVLSIFPSLTRAVERGVKLNVITDDDELHTVFGSQPAAETSWDVCEAAAVHQNA